jgi:peptide deformylase
MIQKILQSGDPKLRDVSKPVACVDKKILSLVANLKDTLTVQKDPEGVGLAAPQIGKNLRVFVILDKGKLKTVINPEVIPSKLTLKQSSNEIIGKPKKSKTKKRAMNHEPRTTSKNIMEGCLSLPNYYGPLRREKEITISYLNEVGEKVTETFTDFPAQIVRHEIDHLNGVLFIDRLLEQKKKLFKLESGEWEEVEI